MKNKRRILEFIMAVTMLLLVYICAGRLPAMTSGNGNNKNAGDKDKNKKIVLLDPGHGGIDPGKVSVTGRNEKEINLEISVRVREKLEKIGYKVFMTREDDAGLYKDSDSNKKTADMKRRCSMAEECKADILVSIHQNSYQSEGVKGAQVFYYSHSDEGEKLAKAIQKGFLTVVNSDNGREAKANDSYYILLNVKCPAVIAECGFLSNYEEAELLEKEEYQEKVAEAICVGVEEYFQGKE